jgi:autotransporter-associated beta strand protein
MAGTITRDTTGNPVYFNVLRFGADGYRIQDGQLQLTVNSNRTSVIDVGESDPASAGWTATIGSVLTDTLPNSNVLAKDGRGILVLEGANTYSGGTRILGGTLRISADNNLGAAASGLEFNTGTSNLTGTLATTASFDTARAITLNTLGTFDVADGTTLGLTGVVSGAGDLHKTGTGTLRLDNVGNTYANTVVDAGRLIGSATSVRGNVGIAAGADLSFDQATDASFAGAISGSGTLTKVGDGSLTLSGNSAGFAGTTWINAGGMTLTGALGGTIRINGAPGGGAGMMADAGLVSGNIDINKNGVLVFDQTADASYGGALSGIGAFYKDGAAALTLTGNSATYSGPSRIYQGLMNVVGTLGSHTTTVSSSGTLSGSGTVLGNVQVEAGGTLAGIGGRRCALARTCRWTPAAR